MLPYIQVHDLRVGPFTIHPFGFLVAVGTLLGVELAKRRGKKVGLPADALMSFIAWMLVGGFVGGHVLDEIFYHPHEVVEQPLPPSADGTAWSGRSIDTGTRAVLLRSWSYVLRCYFDDVAETA